MPDILPTGTVLDRIVQAKLKEVEQNRDRPGPAARSPFTDPGAAFLHALRDRSRPGRAIIAEIKRASPSAGVIRDPFLPGEIAAAYAENGARCVSVLTDREFFGGSLEILVEVRAKIGLPLLRKDFIIDRVQVEEAARAGADAVLLIVRILSDALLGDLYQLAGARNLAVLVEVHDERDLERALALTPRPALIGVNNRDLADFSVSIGRTLSLLPRMPEGTTVVSESGLDEPAALDELRAAGAQAFLVGTALMKAPDPGLALARLVRG